MKPRSAEVHASAPARTRSRVGPSAAALGAVTLFVGTWLHPMTADPNLPLAAFTEYAAAPHWVAVHLLQLAGVGLITGALVLLGAKLSEGPAAECAAFALSGAVASLAVASALQAVDGVALKAMVDRWASSVGPERAGLFQAALAVRQIELGLAAITSVTFGLTAALYGVALLIDRRFPKWLAALAIAGGLPTASSGVVIANSGFSDLAMTMNLFSILLLMVWLILLGVLGWSRVPF
jgi:hypothetical protein